MWLGTVRLNLDVYSGSVTGTLLSSSAVVTLSWHSRHSVTWLIRRCPLDVHPIPWILVHIHPGVVRVMMRARLSVWRQTAKRVTMNNRMLQIAKHCNKRRLEPSQFTHEWFTILFYAGILFIHAHLILHTHISLFYPTAKSSFYVDIDALFPFDCGLCCNAEIDGTI